MSIKSYKDLETWQKAIELVEVVYKETKSFPKEDSQRETRRSIQRG